MIKKIFVCSPYRGDVDRNINYVKNICRYIIFHGHAPFAPHLHYTRFLNEDLEYERTAGILCGLEFLKCCDELWYFDKYGVTEGMKIEIEEARSLGIMVRKVTDISIDNSI